MLLSWNVVTAEQCVICCLSVCSVCIYMLQWILLHSPAIYFRIWLFIVLISESGGVRVIIVMITTVYAFTLLSIHSLRCSGSFICLISFVPTQQH